MAKISPVSIKYMIHASFRVEGPLEKPDVIGAIFGQTEGLLGAELEMRELQKEGKIGRIEVELQTVDGKSVGEIKVPTALDKSETTIIAAALETIDRIGPTEAIIEVTKIEDVRGSKRDYIIDRAKRLLEGLDEGGEFTEMRRTLKEDSRAERIQEYGEERLPAGDISGHEVIVVEGRADVVNMLKNRINNVIGMNGTKLPAEIARLGEQKEITLFIDGDRGGKLIAKNVISNAKVAYVAVAPDGKEVEELTGKEILLALRRRLPREEFMRRFLQGSDFGGNGGGFEMARASAGAGRNMKEHLRAAYDKVKDSKQALLLNEQGDVIKKVMPRELLKNIKESKTKVFAVVLDGPASSSVIKGCEEEGVMYLGANTFSDVEGAKIELVSL